MEAVLNHAERSMSMELGRALNRAKYKRSKSKENLGEPRGQWQATLRTWMDSQLGDAIVASVIVTNILVMCFEADRNAYCDPEERCAGPTIDMLNLLFTIFYTIEVIMRLLAFELTVLKDGWNILDIAVVVLGWLERIFSSVGFGFNLLRLFRVTRLVRASRFLHLFPELHMMVAGFFKAMMAMFWGSFMITCLLLVFALLAVELVHPENIKIQHIMKDPSCIHAYSSVWRSMLTFFQTIVAGDSWGHCSLDLIHENKLMLIPLALAFVFVQLGSMNLILSVIVDSASKAREEDKEKKEENKLKKRQQAADQLLQLLAEIDTDGSGTISYEEFHAGYNSNASLRQLVHDLKLGVDDLRVLLDVMDTQREGNVSYKAFVEFLQNSSTEQLQQNILIARLVKRREDAFDDMVAQLTGIHVSESKMLHGATRTSFEVNHTSDPHGGVAGDKQLGSPVAKMHDVSAGIISNHSHGGESSPSTSAFLPLTPVHLAPVHENSSEDRSLQESPQRAAELPSTQDGSQRAALTSDMVSEYAQKLALCHAQFSHMLEKVVTDFDNFSKRMQTVSLSVDGIGTIHRGNFRAPVRHEPGELFSVSEAGAVVGSSHSPDSREAAARPWFSSWRELNSAAAARTAVKTICCVEIPVKGRQESETCAVPSQAGGIEQIGPRDNQNGEQPGTDRPAGSEQSFI